MKNPKKVAKVILNGFRRHYQLFQNITASIKGHYISQNWPAISQSSADRISYYDSRVRESVNEVSELLGESKHDATLWNEVKQHYKRFLLFHPQAELAETFYNSVFCNLVHRQYYNNQFIFVETTLQDRIPVPVDTEYRSYFPVEFNDGGIGETVKKIIKDFHLNTEFADLERDITLLQKAFFDQAPLTHHQPYRMRFDILKSPFFRNKSAYIIGRVVSRTGIQPFIIPVLHHPKSGLFIDALLTDPRQLSILFGFARAYFMVETRAPSALVRFLKTLLPNKTLAELYSAVGFHKHGKTEFYRELLNHLKASDDQFIIAPGVKGMVMEVFTLPSFPYVFKVIKDKFAPSKNFGRDTVLERYQLVKQHDRIGRMADTHEYKDVVLPKHRFPEELIEQFQETIPGSFSIEGDTVVIKHLYIERRMTPLNIYLDKANPEETEEAIDEYGHALKEMIGVNIFPGDMLLKNFGVTNNRRVVFYDYDEVQYMTEMNFRKIPPPRCYEDEMAAEPWYSVAPNDVFPEELATFVTTLPNARKLLQQLHPDLLDAEYWKDIQKRVANGDFLDVFPYPDKQRFYHQW
ncbi:bifunctional isocitrate dehydrogenase kinase/phosphatase [Parendozoicomonas sp. Alg238-R29]|uniref:bifunctional isocitrate dehydrogenase kinase/phosphatase n=1 Tax=Parendozoicomonas sp. Alg238-R29 TaxID=2993446 RepID=UPI00248E23A9|nr:bifunctional isocitrate dehydrogenase kinase/phosphatase [Parendozoicomonas sp. Alg238-R29]